MPRTTKCSGKCKACTRKRARAEVAEWDRLWSTLVHAIKGYREALRKKLAADERARRGKQLQRAARAIVAYHKRQGLEPRRLWAQIAREGASALDGDASRSSGSTARPIDSMLDLAVALGGTS